MKRKRKPPTTKCLLLHFTRDKMASSCESTIKKYSIKSRWQWNANKDPFGKTKSIDWRSYSDIENLIIEQAYANEENRALLDGYYIDLTNYVQVSYQDSNKQRPVRRTDIWKDSFRIERFTPNPIVVGSSNDRFSFTPIFIREIVKYFHLTKDTLPLKNSRTLSIFVEKAAAGLIEYGKLINKLRQSEFLAKILRENQNADIDSVWKCCVFLYSLESFLYKSLNETMRLIGIDEYEQTWRNQIPTLGPFALLLWENPNNFQVNQTEKLFLYRGADLSPDVLLELENDLNKSGKCWYSFQSFVSCTENQSFADNFGNVLFVMDIRLAFTAQLKDLSVYPDENEVLLFPGVSFTIQQITKDKKKKKTVIHMTLKQRHNSTGFILLFYIERKTTFTIAFRIPIDSIQ